jgi:tripartite-type tricarboxylate transporter receptor subunit TctC
MVAVHLSDVFHQQFYIENRSGAAGMIGAGMVAVAPPDGYTLVISGIGSNIIGPAFYGNATFDGVRDFTYIAYLGGAPVGLLVHPSLGLNTYRDFLAWAKAQKGPIDYMSAGAGSSSFLFGFDLAQREGFSFTHIPYNGSGAAIPDLLAGNVKVATISFSTGSELVRSGAVKALAVSTERRLPAFPDVPTFKELGYKDMVSGSWFALSGPAHLPDEIVQKLNHAVVEALKDPVIQRNLEHDGFDTRPMSPAEVTAFVETESARWTPIAKAAAEGK